MKKTLAIIMAVILAVGLLASCGASSAVGEDSVNSSPMEPGGYKDESDYDSSLPQEPSAEGDGLGAGTPQKQTDFAEKMIYSADVEVETKDFDESVEFIYGLLDRYGAFLESSRVSGKSYEAAIYGYKSLRRATFVIRVPVAHFNTMRDGLEGAGNVLNSYVYSTNITTQFYDAQSRLNAYRTEEERLLDMLSKCETVYDMLEIESRLSDVRYEIEALETTLRNWQNEVDYSTLTVVLSEVEDYTEKVETHRTYWQEIGDGFRRTLSSVGDFFKGLFKFIVVYLPVFILIAVVGAVCAVIVLTVRRRSKKRAERDNGEDGEK